MNACSYKVFIGRSEGSHVLAHSKYIRQKSPFTITLTPIELLNPWRYQSMALSRIAQTYREAETVLVLDADLEESFLGNMTAAEIAMRIFCCGWMERLWTYEECVVSKHDGLYIRFPDGFFSLNFDHLVSIIESYASEWANLYEFIIAADPLQYLSVLRAVHLLQSDRDSDVRSVMLIWESIRGRSVTKAGDEPIIISALLDLDAGEIHRTPVKDRMRKLFTLRSKWPRQFLFSDGARLRTPGYQWAPSSLLINTTGVEMDRKDCWGLRREEGLLVEYPGFTILETSTPTMVLPLLLLEVESNTWFTLSQSRDDDPYDPPDIPPWDMLSPRRGIRSGILISDGTNNRYAGYHYALLVTIIKEEDHVLFGD